MQEPLSARDVAAFVAAVEARSIQGAAESLGLTQSATTKRIQALERRLGASLLSRGRFGVRLTDDGRALYPEARLALDMLAAAERSISTARESRPLRLAASHTVGECVLPAMLADFRSANVDLHPHVDVVNSPAAIGAVKDGTADVGFVEGLDPLDGLDVLAFAEDQIALTVASGHRWAGRSTVRPEELTQDFFISRESGSGTRVIAESALSDCGVRLDPHVTLASLEAVKRSLASGGFALISRFATDAEVATGSLITVPIEGLSIKRRLLAIRLLDSPSREPGRRFWRWLESVSERKAVSKVSAPATEASGGQSTPAAPS